MALLDRRLRVLHEIAVLLSSHVSLLPSVHEEGNKSEGERTRHWETHTRGDLPDLQESVWDFVWSAW